jgi:hypothetical protein
MFKHRHQSRVLLDSVCQSAITILRVPDKLLDDLSKPQCCLALADVLPLYSTQSNRPSLSERSLNQIATIQFRFVQIAIHVRSLLTAQ